MLNILSAIALENGRDKSDEMHGIRLENFKEFVMVWAFNTNPQYDSTVKFLTLSAVSTLKKKGGAKRVHATRCLPFAGHRECLR